MKVLIVDDSLTIRAMIQQVLAKERDIEILGLAAAAGEAMAILAERRADVITLDVDMPGTNGLELLSQLMEHHPYPIVMVSSRMGEGNDARGDALRLGALSCFNKAHVVSHAKDFVKAIRAAYLHKQKHLERYYSKTAPQAVVIQDEAED